MQITPKAALGLVLFGAVTFILFSLALDHPPEARQGYAGNGDQPLDLVNAGFPAIFEPGHEGAADLRPPQPFVRREIFGANRFEASQQLCVPLGRISLHLQDLP